jgi:hypothetical protein
MSLAKATANLGLGNYKVPNAVEKSSLGTHLQYAEYLYME